MFRCLCNTFPYDEHFLRVARMSQSKVNDIPSHFRVTYPKKIYAVRCDMPVGMSFFFYLVCHDRDIHDITVGMSRRWRHDRVCHAV